MLLCIFLFALCSNEAGPLKLDEAEIALSFDAASLIQNAPDAEADGITVAFNAVDDARSLAPMLKAIVEFSGYSHDGFTIESGVLEYVFYSSGMWISNYTVESTESLIITGNGYSSVPVTISISDYSAALAYGYIRSTSEKPSSFEIRSVPDTSLVTIGGVAIDVDEIAYQEPTERYCTVSFSYNAEDFPDGVDPGSLSLPGDVSVKLGEKIEKPEDPSLVLENISFDFLGWYSDESCETLFSFDTEITEDITLYAKWSDYHFDNVTNTYTVKNAEGLNIWAAATKTDSSANCDLVADITLPDVNEGESNWTPIIAFTGSFDGNDHKVSNLRINKSDTNEVGFFGSISAGGKVANLGIDVAYIEGYYYVSGICGRNSGTIEYCYSTGDVSGDSFTGGVCGDNSGTVEYCYSTGNVSGDSFTGGVCGDNNGTVECCYSTGDVSGNSFAGGVCGRNSGTVEYCYSTGGVSGNTGIGGVCGYNSSETATITACYSSGAVSGKNNIGGVCGENNGTVDTCYDGSDAGIDWEDMNTKIEDTGYEYVIGNDGLPELKELTDSQLEVIV